MTTLDIEAVLDAAPLEQLVAAVARRVGLRLVPMSSPTTDDTTPAPRHRSPSSPVTDDLSPVERQRARWRRSQAARRARLRAMTTDDAMTHAPVVVVNTKNNNNSVSGDMSPAEVSSPADPLPGMARPVGAAPDPTPAPPDDLVRRKLRTAAAELLARHDLDRQRAEGATIRSEGGWLRTVAQRIAAERADELAAAVEAALQRWPQPDAAHVIAVLVERPSTAAAPAPVSRRVERPVDRSPRPSRDEVHAGLASVRAALRRTA